MYNAIGNYNGTYNVSQIVSITLPYCPIVKVLNVAGTVTFTKPMTFTKSLMVLQSVAVSLKLAYSKCHSQCHKQGRKR